AIQSCAFEFSGGNGEYAVAFESHHTTIAVVINREATCSIKRQAIRARLTIFRDVRSVIAALLAEYCELSIPIRGVFVNRVVVRIAEKQVTAITVPDWSFGKFETLRQLKNLWV